MSRDRFADPAAPNHRDPVYDSGDGARKPSGAMHESEDQRRAQQCDPGERLERYLVNDGSNPFWNPPETSRRIRYPQNANPPAIGTVTTAPRTRSAIHATRTGADACASAAGIAACGVPATRSRATHIRKTNAPQTAAVHPARHLSTAYCLRKAIRTTAAARNRSAYHHARPRDGARETMPPARSAGNGASSAVGESSRDRATVASRGGVEIPRRFRAATQSAKATELNATHPACK